MSNHLFYGDNLTVLRESIRDESVDLAPPFFGNASREDFLGFPCCSDCVKYPS
jgi:hypothetical protein